MESTTLSPGSQSMPLATTLVPTVVFSLRMLRILTKSATSRRRPTGTDRSRDRSIGRPAVEGMTPKELFARPISTGVLLARNISVRSLSAQVRDTEGLS